MDPFLPPQSPFEANHDQSAPGQLEPVAVAVALLLLLVSGALAALALPFRPPMMVAPVLALFAIALFVPNAPKWAALPSLLAVPVALMAFHLDGAEFQPLNSGFNQQGWALAVRAVLGAAPVYFLARGSLQHALAGITCLVLALSLRDQVAVIGMQLLLPGVAVLGLTALLPYTAAEPGVGLWGALANSIRRIISAPLAWLVTVLGMLMGTLVSMAVLYVGADDPFAAMFDPTSVPWTLNAVAHMVEQAVWGSTVLVGGTLYHRAIRS